jgi:hypothetical protein
MPVEAFENDVIRRACVRARSEIGCLVIVRYLWRIHRQEYGKRRTDTGPH